MTTRRDFIQTGTPLEITTALSHLIFEDDKVSGLKICGAHAGIKA